MIPSTQQRDRAIVIAHRRGVSLAQLGRVNGLSRARVKTIVDRAGRLAGLAGTVEGELSARTRNAINNDGCLVIPSAVKARYTMKVLLRVPNIGVKGRQELQEWLVRHGQEPIA